jgi:hypothetical protein
MNTSPEFQPLTQMRPSGAAHARRLPWPGTGSSSTVAAPVTGSMRPR